jgi:hypothetical protein
MSRVSKGQLARASKPVRAHVLSKAVLKSMRRDAARAKVLVMHGRTLQDWYRGTWPSLPTYQSQL